jgi:REP element-mobilizing transposase RayT
MKEEHIKKVFIDTIQRTQEKYQFELTAYVVMGNHFHLILRTVEGGESISRIMQYIKARFAERFNRINSRIGPFWNERFRDTIVEHQESPLDYFLWLVWYIAWNPVRKGTAKDPESYPFSSINSYLRSISDSKLKITLHEYYQMLGKSFRERRYHFLQAGEIFRTHIMRVTPEVS